MGENTKRLLPPSIRSTQSTNLNKDFVPFAIYIPTQDNKFNTNKLFRDWASSVFSNAFQFLFPQSPEKTQWGSSPNILSNMTWTYVTWKVIRFSFKKNVEYKS